MDKNDAVKNQSADVNRELSSKSKKEFKGISYGQISALALAFIFGAVIILICQNLTKSEIITFSTTSLVSFLFSIALAGASIVLAITAISLSKASEQTMVNRSDQSIKLQNEVFIKTTDALQRIESSTGVTEKRVEDILSGRAGDISERIIAKTIGEKMIPQGERTQLEEDIKKSILDEIEEGKRRPGGMHIFRDKHDDEEKKKSEKIEKRKVYEQFRDAILAGIECIDKVTSEKIGNGSYYGVGEELVDGVFVIDAQKFGVSIFSKDQPPLDSLFYNFYDFLTRLANEISDGKFSKIFVVFDELLRKESKYIEQIEKVKKLIRQEVGKNLIIISGTGEKIEQQILSSLGLKKTA